MMHELSLSLLSFSQIHCVAKKKKKYQLFYVANGLWLFQTFKCLSDGCLRRAITVLSPARSCFGRLPSKGDHHQ